MSDSLSTVNVSAENVTKVVKIFINNVNSYKNLEICKNLPLTGSFSNFHTEYSIRCSLAVNFDFGDFNLISDIRKCVTEILHRNTDSYFRHIIESEVILYDVGYEKGQIEEVEKLLEFLLEEYKNLKENMADKYLILVTSPLCWATTEPYNSEKIFYEADYRKRRPHPNYVRHKNLEKEVYLFQKKTKSKVRTLVVCPGYSYGGPNNLFNYIFQLAFLNKDIIPVPEPGLQELPLIYINDLVGIMKKIITNFPSPKIRYVFAVDPKKISLLNFTRSIAEKIAGHTFKVRIVPKEELLKYDKDLVTQYVLDITTSNFKMHPTYFEDYPFTFADYNETIEAIVNEFRMARNLTPMKIIIDGPPCVGKTSVARFLAKYYELDYIDISKVVETVIKNLENDIAEAESFLLYFDIENAMLANILEQESDPESDPTDRTEYINEIKEGIEDKIEKWKFELDELQTYMNSEETDADPETQFDITKRCFTKIISSKLCYENNGCIIDGFPFNYDEAKEIFQTNSEEDDSSDDDHEEEYDPVKKFMKKSNLLPEHVIILDASDDLLCKRAMQFTEPRAVELHTTEEEMLSRLEQYRERNNEDTSITSYFNDNDVAPITINISEDTKVDDITENIRKELGPPHVYPISRCARMRALKAERQKREEEELEAKLEVERCLEKFKSDREDRLRKWTRDFQRLKAEEEIFLEAKSLPLRNYLAQFVLPVLTEGLVKVSEVQPEDHTDFLAEYLFSHNPIGKTLPDQYNDELKELLLGGNKETAIDLLVQYTKDDGPNPFKCESPGGTTTRCFVEHKELSLSIIEKILKQNDK